MFFVKSICYTNTKHISYESKVTIHHLLSNFISEVYALDTNSYVKQEAAGKSRRPPVKRRKSEDVSEFRLSSAYECQTDDPDLELRVTVLNVNEGHNQELMEHCQTLKEYAQYVAKVRKYTSLGELSLEEAVECAVEECIKEGILAEFLIQNRAEVISMSIFEYNKDEEEKKLRKAEFEAGREAGIEEGRMELLKQLIKRKLSKGKSIDEIAEELEESVTVIQNLIGEHEIK